MQEDGTATPGVGYWAAEWDPDATVHGLYYTSVVDGNFVNVTTVPVIELARPLFAVAGYRAALLWSMLGAVAAAFAARALALRAGADEQAGLAGLRAHRPGVARAALRPRPVGARARPRPHGVGRGRHGRHRRRPGPLDRARRRPGVRGGVLHAHRGGGLRVRRGGRRLRPAVAAAGLRASGRGRGARRRRLRRHGGGQLPARGGGAGGLAPHRSGLGHGVGRRLRPGRAAQGGRHHHRRAVPEHRHRPAASSAAWRCCCWPGRCGGPRGPATRASPASPPSGAVLLFLLRAVDGLGFVPGFLVTAPFGVVALVLVTDRRVARAGARRRASWSCWPSRSCGCSSSAGVPCPSGAVATCSRRAWCWPPSASACRACSTAGCATCSSGSAVGVAVFGLAWMSHRTHEVGRAAREVAAGRRSRGVVRRLLDA